MKNEMILKNRHMIDSASGLEASQAIRLRRPDGVFCALRIGYAAVETIGGVLPRLRRAA